MILDSIEYLDTESINGLNLYCYCNNDPVNKYDFVITLSMILTVRGIGVIVDAIIGTGVALYKNYDDDGNINGSIGWQCYVGNIVGSAIAGTVTGFATLLGVGIVVSAIYGYGLVFLHSSMTIGGALGLSLAVSAITGGLGYIARASIDPKEKWNTGLFFKEIGVNTLNGLVSFASGFIGGYLGYRYSYIDCEWYYKLTRFGVRTF